ncbi:hypothetical protein B0J11DRAFT_504399 [Dendryphion nanum]|uniref:Uncharacterized protein n=1 Tax=Dendryphion nanum TaxID=256645 RepID=A0A9P9E2A4_9PLEO|nr:hypothetical protein B0J11DRAFT_504399 [Dendryphion nanum]
MSYKICEVQCQQNRTAESQAHFGNVPLASSGQGPVRKQFQYGTMSHIIFFPAVERVPGDGERPGGIGRGEGRPWMHLLGPYPCRHSRRTEEGGLLLSPLDDVYNGEIVLPAETSGFALAISASGFSYHPAGCPAGCPTGDIAKSFSAVWASATLIASIVARSRFPLFNTNRLHLYHEIRRPISSTPATPQEAGQAGPSAIISCACPQPLTWRKPAWHEMRTRAGDVSSGERDGSRMESRLKDRRRPVPFSGHPLAVTSPLGSQSPSGAVVC